jgi:putative ABC transport system permease protein
MSTLVDDRPDVEPTPVRRVPVARSTSPTASWKFAARLARREVRRRPGRTILVMLLIAVPVIGMTLGSIVFRTTQNDEAASFAREFGTADLAVSSYDTQDWFSSTSPLGDDAPQLPSGSTTLTYASSSTYVRAEVNGEITSTYVELSDIDLTNPIATDTVEVRRGRIPTATGEVLLGRDVAKRFGVDVGDSLRMVRPDLQLKVVGIGRDISRFDADVMIVPGFDRTLYNANSGATLTTLIDVPADSSDRVTETIAAGFGAFDEFDEFDMPEFSVRTATSERFFSSLDNETAKTLAWGWVGGAVAFIAVGIVVAAAFATSARRQLVTIGQLSSNGASERLVRRTMGLQGMWTGAFGALLGLGLAIVGALIAFRSGLFEVLLGHGLSTISVVASDVVVIGITAVVAATVAALIPARSASRIPVLSALAGRRPVATPPRWMVPAGIALFLGGLFLLGGAASMSDAGDFGAMLAVIGSLGVMFGIVCASPLIVSLVGKVGSKGSGVVRLASRSLDRSRARSAAVLTAIAVVGALAVAGATASGSAEDNRSFGEYVPDLARVSLYFNGYSDVVPNSSGIVDYPPIIPSSLPGALRSEIEKVLPDATWTPLTYVIDDPEPYQISTGETIPPNGVDPTLARLGGLVVADAAVLDLLDLSSEQEDILDKSGVLAVSPYLSERGLILTPDGYVEVDLRSSLALLGFDSPVDTVDEERRANALSLNSEQLGGLVVSPAFVEQNGLPTGVSQYVIANPVDLTSAQRDQINDLRSAEYGGDAFTPEASAPEYAEFDDVEPDVWSASFDSPIPTVPWALIQGAIALASLLMVLMVVAIGLSLAATESRDERDVLHAVGAAPRTLRRVAAAKAWVLATGAAVVAVPAGYITVFVVTRATDNTAPVPFAVMGALLVVIPLLAAGATLATSAIAQRFKPITYSTFVAD